MVEAPRPLTLVLGGAGLWVLCLLILALAGLGSRFAAPENASAPPPLPQVSLVPTVSRLGPWSGYADVASRPLLNEGRHPVAVSASEATGGSDELDVTLSSVLITSRVKIAILTDNKDGSTRSVKLGEVVRGSNWRLLSLEPRSAVLEGPSGQRTLMLRVFDGRSGEAPTAVAAAATETAPPPRVVPSPAPTPPAANPPPPSVAATKPDPNQMSQEEQVEAIRRRIEARRAQMRAEAESAASQTK